MVSAALFTLSGYGSETAVNTIRPSCKKQSALRTDTPSVRKACPAASLSRGRRCRFSPYCSAASVSSAAAAENGSASIHSGMPRAAQGVCETSSYACTHAADSMLRRVQPLPSGAGRSSGERYCLRCSSRKLSASAFSVSVSRVFQHASRPAQSAHESSRTRRVIRAVPGSFPCRSCCSVMYGVIAETARAAAYSRCRTAEEPLLSGSVVMPTVRRSVCSADRGTAQNTALASAVSAKNATAPFVCMSSGYNPATTVMQTGAAQRPYRLNNPPRSPPRPKQQASPGRPQAISIDAPHRIPAAPPPDCANRYAQVSTSSAAAARAGTKINRCHDANDSSSTAAAAISESASAPLSAEGRRTICRSRRARRKKNAAPPARIPSHRYKSTPLR